VAAGSLLGAVADLGTVLPATLTAGAVLQALGAILVRGLGLAAVTVPAGVAIATIPPSQDLAVRPEWTAQERRRRVRAEAGDRRRAERLAQSPRVAASDALGVAIDPTPALPSWRRGRLVVPPAGQLGLTTLMVGQPGTGKSTAAERLAQLAAQQRRAICVIDGKGTDGLAEAIAAAVLVAWPEARIRSFPEHPVDLWRATPQQMANRLVAAWRFSDEAEFYGQTAMLGLRLALTAPGPACSTSLELVTRLDPAWLTRAWQGHPAELSVIPSTDKRLGDVALRAANLAAALGPAWDGDWWLDDVDVALFTIPTLDNPKDGDAAMRVLLAAYGQHVSRRHRSRRPSWLLFDEFSAVQGGRPLGHQHRGALPLRRRRRHPVGPVGRRPSATRPNENGSWPRPPR
jgi:hypothetical protein